MSLSRIINVVYAQPWAIETSRHASIRQALEAYMAGAQFPFDDLDEEDEKAATAIVGKVAIIPIEGTILPKASGLEAKCGAFSLEKFRADLKAAAANPAVESIVLNISSGGGAITGVPEAADLIASVAKVKNLVAYTGDCIGSAAYWLASQANRIYASKSARVGSVGVYLALLDVSRAMELEVVKLELFKSQGAYKAMGLPGNPLSEEQRALLQAGVDKSYAQFVSYIKAKRPNVAAKAMEGQMFDCEDAIKAGLVDGEVNELDQLIAFLNGGK